MNQVQVKRHLAFRQAQTKRILAAPGLFRLCTQCLSIAFKSASTCPICGAWRWSEDSLVVEVVAQHAATFAFPATAGVAPRIGEAKPEAASKLKTRQSSN